MAKQHPNWSRIVAQYEIDEYSNDQYYQDFDDTTDLTYAAVEKEAREVSKYFKYLFCLISFNVD